MTALLWLRRDLRVRDHPALRAALERAEEAVPVFCLDDRLLHGRFASGARTQFLIESLADLDGSLRDRGGGLVVRRGPPERELALLAREVGATEVHFTRELTPYARRRGERVSSALGDLGVELHAHPGLTVADDVTALVTGEGRPYTVFSPFHRTWLEADRRQVLPAPRKVPLPAGLDRGSIPALAELGLEQEVEDPARGGEAEGRRALDRFLRGPVDDYGTQHDQLGSDRTSRLSPYLHLGCVSPRAIEDRLGDAKGPQAFRRQLCWRDFYHQVIHGFPANAHDEFQERYRRSIDWRDDDESFERWTAGRTGFPLVDAGMRQLRREGWMHNRARRVVG
jgi:deoxyribodipyrimidine photo-lyase